jgi:hypothetical protein
VKLPAEVWKETSSYSRVETDKEDHKQLLHRTKILEALGTRPRVVKYHLCSFLQHRGP